MTVLDDVVYKKISDIPSIGKLMLKDKCLFSDAKEIDD